MCGIAGLLGRIHDSNRAALRRMKDAMIHRGPDAEGVWESQPDARNFGAMLAHRRLSILDLSPAGAQPMTDPVTGQVLVFNGEIYNYRAIRERLADRGQAFVSTGDTAVLLRALGVEGRGAVASLRGMFAFALWDAQRRELCLARDPLGIKPLYVARNPDPHGEWTVAFASEVRALLASGLVGHTPKLDPRAPASMVWNGFIVGPHTAVEGIELLPPGHLQVFDFAGRKVASEDFWSIREPGRAEPLDEGELAAHLEECVRLHLLSDVPLGIFLSGGVDSSAVANLAKRASGGPIHTFTLAFQEKELDESRFAREIARAIGTEHQELVLTEQRFVQDLDRALDSLDQPTFDGLNSYYMSRAVREAGFTVALVGTGGDELFGGYPSFRDLPVLHRWSQRLRGVPRGALVAGARGVARALEPSWSEFPPQARWAKLPDMVRSGDDLLSLYQLAYALFLPSAQRDLLGGRGADALVDGLPREARARLVKETRGRAALSAISVMEQRLFLGERLLRDNDAASMAASLEQRLPLVDHVLFESVDRLAEGSRYQPVRKKSALRRIGLRGLDPRLFDRPKAGFVLPFDRWIRGSLGDVMNGTMRDARGLRAVGLEPAAVERLWRGFRSGAPGMYWSRAWALYVFVRWCQRHGLEL